MDIRGSNNMAKSHGQKISSLMRNIVKERVREWELVTGNKLKKNDKEYLVASMTMSMFDAYAVGKGY
jgi:hypothetical protein